MTQGTCGRAEQNLCGLRVSGFSHFLGEPAKPLVLGNRLFAYEAARERRGLRVGRCSFFGKDLARATPRRDEHRENWFARLQDFRREIGLTDESDAWFVLAHVYVFNCGSFLSAPFRNGHATDGQMT